MPGQQVQLLQLSEEEYVVKSLKEIKFLLIVKIAGGRQLLLGGWLGTLLEEGQGAEWLVGGPGEFSGTCLVQTLEL